LLGGTCGGQPADHCGQARAARCEGRRLRNERQGQPPENLGMDLG
jgi:hypothetical protein